MFVSRICTVLVPYPNRHVVHHHRATHSHPYFQMIRKVRQDIAIIHQLLSEVVS